METTKATNNNNINTAGYSLSSWNYGAFSANNPSFAHTTKNKQTSLYTPDMSQFNKYGKKYLKEEEKIVTNEYMRGYNQMKFMEDENYNKMMRAKSAKGLRDRSLTNHETSLKNDTKFHEEEDKDLKGKMSRSRARSARRNPPVPIKSDTSNYKYKLTFEEWKTVKNKQLILFNQIKHLKEEEELRQELTNKKVDKKYNEIKNQKIKEWTLRKKEEAVKKKEKEYLKQLKLEHKKRQKEIENEEMLNVWFLDQAKKMENDIRQKREEARQKEELRRYEREKKYRNRQLNREIFNEWKAKKDAEIRERKIKEKLEKENESKSYYSYRYNRFNHRGFPIGPYTDAAALKEIQRFVADKCTEDDVEDEEGVVNDGEEGKNLEGYNGELNEEQIAKIKELQKMEMKGDPNEEENDI